MFDVEVNSILDEQARFICLSEADQVSKLIMNLIFSICFASLFDLGFSFD